MDWLSIGATALGGLLGSKAGGDQQQTATATKDPWAPAQPYMLDNLKNEASLQQYYQATPFNQQQTEGYSNLFGDIGNFRNNVMPGLMDFANKGMTSSYQRQSGGNPGSGGGYGGAVQPGGMRQAGQGPFSVNQGAQQGVNGLLDLNGAMNPHANGAIKAPAPATQQSFSGGLMGGGNSGGSGGNGPGGASNPAGGIGIGAYTDAINDKALGIAKTYSPLSIPGALIAGLVSKGISESEALSMVNSMDDPVAALNALQGWTNVDPSYGLYGGGSSGNSGGFGSGNEGGGFSGGISGGSFGGGFGSDSGGFGGDSQGYGGY